jgi:hypothetical protein
MAVVKVNDDQYIELLQGDARSQGQLDHLGLYTDDPLVTQISKPLILEPFQQSNDEHLDNVNLRIRQIQEQ